MYKYNPFEPNIATTEYSVQPGDKLWEIALDFNTTVEDIIELNNLTSTTIYPGQVLLVPVQSPNMMSNVDQFTQFQQQPMMPDFGQQPPFQQQPMMPGFGQQPPFQQQSMMPGFGQQPPFPQQPMFGQQPPFQQQMSSNTYVVQRGDTLGSIASRFNLTVEELIYLNPQLLRPGQILNIR